MQNIIIKGRSRNFGSSFGPPNEFLNLPTCYYGNILVIYLWLQQNFRKKLSEKLFRNNLEGFVRKECFGSFFLNQHCTANGSLTCKNFLRKILSADINKLAPNEFNFQREAKLFSFAQTWLQINMESF